MKTVEVDNEKGLFIIRFKLFDSVEWTATKDLVKQLSGREFHPKGKYWTAPILKETEKILRAAEFEFLGEPPQPLSEKNNDDWKKIEIDEEQVPNLRPYQYDALRFLSYRKGRGLIGDDMGTGKTVMALSWAKLEQIRKPILIVVPATIKLQWRREFRKWFSKMKNVNILYGKKSFKLSPTTSYIINWDILSDWIDELYKIDFELIIGDEIQAIGNPKSKRSKAFKILAKNIPQFVPLSGTPLRSCPAQFFPCLNLLSSDLFPNYWKYLHRYCDPKHNGFGFEFKGCTNGEELHNLVSKVMLRRTKKEVLHDLPDKVKVVVPLDDVNLATYLALEDQMKDEFAIITNKNKLRQMFDDLSHSAFEAKKQAVVKWIETFISTGEKLIVGAYHRKVVEFLSDVFSLQSVVIYGGVTGSAREKAIHNFINNNSVRILIGNILSAGIGIDGFQKVCSNSATVELSWSPKDHEQFEDRLHRSEQKDSVTSYYLIAPDTVEEDIVKLLDEKSKNIDKVIDGKEIGEIDLLGDLLRLRNEKT